MQNESQRTVVRITEHTWVRIPNAMTLDRADRQLKAQGLSLRDFAGRFQGSDKPFIWFEQRVPA